MGVAGANEAAKKAREELVSLSKASDAKLAEEAELEERVRQIQLETERAKEAHHERNRQFEARRQAALQQYQAIMEQRTEESGGTTPCRPSANCWRTSLRRRGAPTTRSSRSS